MPNGGRLSIETKNVELGEEYCRVHKYVRPGDYVLLAVSDNGLGMDTETIEQIFEPFFTTKEMGKGTGLGLATVYGIVKQHAGLIDVESASGEGTTFRVYFPAGSGAPESREAQPDELPSRGSETILLAEDHEGLRQSAQEMLETLGSRVIVASDGLEAVQLFKRNREQIAMAVLDVVMPGISGPDAYLQMAAIRPDLRVVFSTGYAREAESLTSILQKGRIVLAEALFPEKPGPLDPRRTGSRAPIVNDLNELAGETTAFS